MCRAVCCEGCITEHNQEVSHSVCAERNFRTGSTVQDNRFYQILKLITVILRLYIDQIKFRPLIISVISFIFNSILSFSIFTHNPAALYALSNINVIFLLHNHTHNNLCFHLTPISSNFPPTLHIYSSVH